MGNGNGRKITPVSGLVGVVGVHIMMQMLSFLLVELLTQRFNGTESLLTT
jgi:hypothetical protein